MANGPITAPERLLAESEWLVRLARSLVESSDDARDLAQDALTAALAHPPEDERPVRPWLARIAKNLSISQGLGRRRRAFREQDAARSESVTPTDQVVAQVEMQRTVVDAVLALEEPYRLTILLRYWENLPPRDIAARMQVPVESVRTRLKRGLELLRKRLDRRHGERGVWLGALLPIAHGLPLSAAATGAAVASTFAMSLLTKSALAALAVFAVFWFGREMLDSASIEDPLVRAPAVEGGTGMRAMDAAPTDSEAAARMPATGGALDEVLAESGTKTLELLVRSSEGTALTAARLVIFRGEAVLADGTTGVDGLARFPAGQGQAEVAVHAPGWPITRAALELEAGRRTVILTEGALLGGWVLIDGAVPSESLEIRFEQSQLASQAASLPESVNRLLGVPREKRNPSAGQATIRLVTATDSNGAFLFHGLTPDLSGTLTWDGRYVLEPTEEKRQEWHLSSLTSAVPRLDLKLRLTPGIQLRLRVVDATGLPVADASVGVTSIRRSENSTSTSMLYGAADKEGRYSGSLGQSPPTEVSVQVAREDGLGSSRHKLICPPNLRGVWDVGDLALVDVHTILVHVQDADGAPISGARGGAIASQDVSNARSNANGDLELPFRPEDRQILVQALGYESSIVEAPADADRVVATLSKVCLLEFTIHDGADVDRRPLALTLTGDPPMFIDEAPGSPRLLQVFGSSYSRDNDDRGTFRHTTEHDEDGRWKIAGVRPGLPLKAELKTDAGTVVAEAEIAPLSRGEHRSVELVMKLRARTLRVQLLGPDQQFVQGARVFPHPHTMRAVEGSRGIYTLSSIYDDGFTLSAEAPGFPTKRVFFVSVPPEEMTITLDAPHSLEIELVAPDGSPLPGRLEVKAGSDKNSAKNGVLQPSGRWVVNNLPPGEVQIYVSGDAGMLTLAHDMSESFRRIVVGTHGVLTTRAELSDDEKYRPWSIAIYRAGASQLEARAAVTPDTSGLAFGKYDVCLERREPSPPWRWTRVGALVAVDLDEGHPTAEVTLHP